MTADKIIYPGPGCLVEFMQGNSPMQAVVLETQGERLRVYALNRRESKFAATRLLPWSGPALAASGKALSRQEMDQFLDDRRALRASIAAGLSALEVWELTQGEVRSATAEWLAGLVWERPSVDQEAALGHVLLAARTHFRFTPPEFEIFPEEMVAAREREAEAVREREAFAVTGAQFFRKLHELAQRKSGPPSRADLPEDDLADRLKTMLLARIADPDQSGDAALWKLLTKGLPDSPHLALILATAWGLVPEHYNFYLDRIGFERGEAWADAFADECAALAKAVAPALESLENDPTPYVSVDPADTRDRDDAFFVGRTGDGGFELRVALACPALVWPYGGPLDKAVLRRASSLYLPEGDEHMLPAGTGRALFSLDAGLARPSLTVHLRLSAEGDVLAAEPKTATVRIAANLSLERAEALLSVEAGGEHAAMLQDALTLARLLQERRIAAGAVITERPDPEVSIAREKGETVVRIENGPDAALAHLAVGEIMVCCNGALAEWGRERDLPLLYRTQDVALPREFAGIWSEPQDIARVVRALPPASLESVPRRHAGLGLPVYGTFSSPIRRYTDLLNQGQVLHLLSNGAPGLTQTELTALLPLLGARADAVQQVQRLRPRYWKLVFFRSRGDKIWWDAVVADENEAFATITLPWAQLLVRGRRRFFGDKLYPGMRIEVRLGKIDPLLGEIQVLEAREA